MKNEKSKVWQIEKSKLVTIKLHAVDIIRIKAKALKAGLPYKTLILSVLHKYAESL